MHDVVVPYATHPPLTGGMPSRMNTTMRHSPCTLSLLLATLWLGVASGPAAAAAEHIASLHGDEGDALHIPIRDDTGQAWTMQGRLCRPEGVTRPRLVVINHGSPPDAADRPHMTLANCRAESVQWFMQRHYAVVLALRLGYGATGGPWTEGYDGCDNADYYKAGMETARQIKTIVDFVTALPGYAPSGVVVVGQSAGGWGTLAYDSMPHPQVAAFIDMAGGRGGHFHGTPNTNCHADRLVEAARRFGTTASTPVLWIYTPNDSYFNPELVTSMYQAFTQAGGKAQRIMPAAYGDDGHHLFFGRGGSATWGPPIEAFLATSNASASP